MNMETAVESNRSPSDEELKALSVQEMEEQLVQAGRTAQDRIRTWVVPAERRVDFDRDVAGLLVSAPPSSEL